MSAIISPCGRLRFRLERDVGMDGPVYAYFGVNGSTAGPLVNDHTVVKWIGFTKINGGRRFIVGNVSPVRATNVKDLAKILVTPAEYRENLDHLSRIIEDADILVPCWGARSKAPKCMQNDFDTVLAMLLASGKPVKHFGLTISGDPKHPLMLGYNTPFVDWIATTQQGEPR